MMRTFTVELGDRSYPIYIGSKLLDDSELLRRHADSSQILLVSNETVAPLYLEKITAAFDDRRIASVILPDGEAFKTLDSASVVFDALLAHRFGRTAHVIALGGGVIGDITGFVAACYQRGVPFIQIPTTLLAQVDSSVGGKTGVNHPRGKNMIGAFHQPKCVIADTATLNTLPDRELSAGLAEIIKYGLIRDPLFFDWLEQHVDGMRARDPELLAEAIERSCVNKAEVVAADERESGERATLNLGHTFGHAIESGSGYGLVLHGEAVAIGMCQAADLSRRLGWLSSRDVARILALIEKAGLPLKPPPNLTAETFLEYMAVDKKNVEGSIRLILLQAIGRATLPMTVSADLLRATLDEYGHA